MTKGFSKLPTRSPSPSSQVSHDDRQFRKFSNSPNSSLQLEEMFTNTSTTTKPGRSPSPPATLRLTSPRSALGIELSPMRSLLPDSYDSMNFAVNEMAGKIKSMMMDNAAETGEEELEMMDYDAAEDHQHERRLEEDKPNTAQHRNLKLTSLRVFITMAVGVTLGLCGFGVSRAVAYLIRVNLSILHGLMSGDKPAAAFFAIMGMSIIMTTIVALLVTFGSWQTRGSGVGRLNAYLSGMYSSKFLTFKTLFVKIFGLILNISAGIKQGMEGPFIHIGAMIGSHVTRIIVWILRKCFGGFGIEKYTSIVSGVVDERMFISGGAAAGFSVAFNAPIAGVLYVQDGAFAYWSGDYTFRTFLCTMTAVATFNLCLAKSNVLQTRGLIDLENQARTSITLQEFPGFILLGIMGGLFGALFTKLNVALERLRSKHLSTKRLPNVLDVLACTIATILLCFILPFLFGCDTLSESTGCLAHSERCLRFHCGPNAYSDLATFFFTLPEETIRILYDRTMTNAGSISYGVLVCYCFFYFLMSAFSYGMAVPGGLFIPSIIIGGAYGRIMGLVMSNFIPEYVESGNGLINLVNPGVYAVLGSASMLGGMTRMTLPISVMLIEITSDAQFLIPIMLVVLLAKVIADRLIGSLYSEHLRMDGILMVFGDRIPRAFKKLFAKDIMSKGHLVTLNVIESVESAHNAIVNTKHNAFPVIDNQWGTFNTFANHTTSNNSRNGRFLGLIQRRHLAYILTSTPCFETPEEARDSHPLTAILNGHNSTSDPHRQSQFFSSPHRKNHVDLTDFIDFDEQDDMASPTTSQPNFPTFASPILRSRTDSFEDDVHQSHPYDWQSSANRPIRQLDVQLELLAHYVNLSSFIDEGAYMVSEQTSARRVWALFRSLGMRHIVVINRNNQPVGMITRSDLLNVALKA